MPEIIDRFNGRYYFLSNFAESPVGFGGYVGPSVEHAYQASKTRDPIASDAIINAATPGEAKRLGRIVQMRPDWEQIKLYVMAHLLRQKFSGPLGRRLLETGDAILIEGNTWGDRYWGTVGGVGENWLGRLLMVERSRLAFEGERP